MVQEIPLDFHIHKVIQEEGYKIHYVSIFPLHDGCVDIIEKETDSEIIFQDNGDTCCTLAINNGREIREYPISLVNRFKKICEFYDVEYTENPEHTIFELQIRVQKNQYSGIAFAKEDGFGKLLIVILNAYPMFILYQSQKKK